MLDGSTSRRLGKVWYRGSELCLLGSDWYFGSPSLFFVGHGWYLSSPSCFLGRDLNLGSGSYRFEVLWFLDSASFEDFLDEGSLEGRRGNDW